LASENNSIPEDFDFDFDENDLFEEDGFGGRRLRARGGNSQRGTWGNNAMNRNNGSNQQKRNFNNRNRNQNKR